VLGKEWCAKKNNQKQNEFLDYGGDSSKVSTELKHVEAICATMGAFAALRKDGTVVTWGTLKPLTNQRTKKKKKTNPKQTSVCCEWCEW